MLPTVPVSPIRLDDYIEPAGEDVVKRLRKAAEPFKGARVLHINSTAFGGGVSELLLTHLGLMRDLGIEANWQLIQGSEEFFAATKAAHNGLQGADIPWTAHMEQVYMERMRANAPDVDGSYDFYVIHDPQPLGLLEVIQEQRRREGKWIWRCHIDTSSPNPKIWDYFAPKVNLYDAVIFTMKDFEQPQVSVPKVAFISPTIDPLSMKNVYLDPDTSYAVLRHYGIDRHRPIATQVSRFDPWKDPLGVIDAYRIVKKEWPQLQLVLVGSLAHDDPQGWQYLEATEEYRRGDDDIHLLTNFEHVGNLEVNAFQRSSTVIVQKSLREGFGLVVSEGMWKKKVVVGGNVGGIRLQLSDGETGFLVDSVDECADRIGRVLSDPGLRYRIGNAALERVRGEFLSLRELEDYLTLMESLR
ncbi:MAG: glycosyltransferase [Actinomycetota bacterium]